MKRIVAMIAVLVLVLSVAGGIALADGRSTATNLFEFDGKYVYVTVDLSDGWSVEYGLNGTYLFDGENDGRNEAAAYGTYVDQEEYDAIVAAYSGYESYAELENGIRFVEEDGNTKYVLTVDEGLYFMITVVDPDNAEAVFARFEVKPDEVMNNAEEMTEG